MLRERNAFTFSPEAFAILLVLIALVLVGAYCLMVFDSSHGEGIATLVGAAATIFAGWLAWESLTFQAHRADHGETIEKRIQSAGDDNSFFSKIGELLGSADGSFAKSVGSG